MHNPFKYRPDDNDPDALDWEDNAVSNAMAWVSDSLFPSWCGGEDHFTNRLTAYLWAECSCCLSVRFFAIGAIVGSILTAIVT